MAGFRGKVDGNEQQLVFQVLPFLPCRFHLPGVLVGKHPCLKNELLWKGATSVSQEFFEKKCVCVCVLM